MGVVLWTGNPGGNAAVHPTACVGGLMNVPPVNPRHLEHWLAIRASLDSKVQKWLDATASRMKPLEFRNWLGRLALRSVPETIKHFQGLYSKLGTKLGF